MVVVVVEGASCGSSAIVVWRRGKWLGLIPGAVPESVKWSIVEEGGDGLMVVEVVEGGRG